MDKIVELFKTYTFGLPIGLVAIILLLIDLKVKKLIFKLIALALILAAAIFFILQI